MNRHSVLHHGSIIASLLLFLSVPLMAQNGQELFETNCSACHTVGGGRLVGPDLQGVTSLRSPEWLMKWTKSSQTLIASGDADAKAIFAEFGELIMPDQSHLPDADITAIYAYIGSKGGEAAEGGGAPVANASDDATPEQIQRGRMLFEGSHRFANGGASCMSCHNVNYANVHPGGLLAKDLTEVYKRMGGDAGLKGILGAPPFPAMAQTYTDHPLTEQEIADLIAFLRTVSDQSAKQQAASFNPLLMGGGIGVCCVFLLILVIWFKRKRFSVKADIFNRQIKSI
ncbi:MAG: cytochrome c [Chlorobi bacterium]|nr:MAG: cytochrome c [Bacteroidota bacterium]KXK34845.1 MAG: cytochrome c [Chlorobi bacterium OLB6]MBE2265007.1 cytochrome c [Flavobacteriales bacterium]MBL1161561.1 cytochrome c [Chlorobiota bacterium]MBW7854144.1 cytochrome c [Candidatus Kapabacteria bacterium]MCC6332267.1 cytochrome c [Ignavibacteria bacterium]